MLVLLWIALLVFCANLDTDTHCKEARVPCLTVSLIETVGDEHVYAIERNTPSDMVKILRQKGYVCHTGTIPSVVALKPCFTIKGPMLFGEYASLDAEAEGWGSWPPDSDCAKYMSQAGEILAEVFPR